MQKGFREKIRIFLGRSQHETRPVFLVGNSRSGTSMLVFKLAVSGQVELYNEDNSRAFDNFFLKPLPQLQSLIDRSRAEVVLFKPIKETFRAVELLGHFENARLLFIFRHFDDVVHSARKKFFENRPKRGKYPGRTPVPPVDRWMQDDFADFTRLPPPAHTKQRIRDLYETGLNLNSKIALHWLFQNALFFDLGLEASQRVMLINYEDLVRDPAPAFNKICHFIGVAFDPKMAAGVHEDSVASRPPPEISEAIRQACQAMWQALMDHYMGQTRS